MSTDAAKVPSRPHPGAAEAVTTSAFPFALSHHLPRALVPLRADVWAIALNGDAQLIVP